MMRIGNLKSKAGLSSADTTTRPGLITSGHAAATSSSRQHCGPSINGDKSWASILIFNLRRIFRHTSSSDELALIDPIIIGPGYIRSFEEPRRIRQKGIKMASENDTATDYIELASDIVSAFVSNNSVPISDLPALIASVHATLTKLTAGAVEEKAEPLNPAVPVKRSVTADFIVCLEDGKKFKSLKRHLRTRYGMTPEEYRAKWSLPSDYPMVAPNYAAARSELAKNMGLGQQRRKTRTAAAEAKPPAPRGRRPRQAAAAEG